jgi:LmbE family N-acetylglucosaminyl deacetylase
MKIQITISKNPLTLHNRKRIIAIICLLSAICHLPFAVKNSNAQVRPVYNNGALGLGQLLRRLQTTASAMHTGAHPDDEDTALIARLARGDAARVVYFSLNRGEGGQNIIGSELFEPLGVIRTEELLQSRRLDGGEQLFTRVMDYGFSKTRAEAAEKWTEQIPLADMVRAIRTFRPLVIISRFSGTPADGHGHHQLAGYLTPIAFKAAADTNQFPDQLKEGLRPWQARKLYVGQGFSNNPNNQPTLTVQTGEYDPLLGRSYFEIAMEGRSQHKSQEMGLLEIRGAQQSGERLIERIGITGEDKNIFDGLDVSIKGIASLLGLKQGVIDDELNRMQTAATKALAEYDPFNPEKIIPYLAEGLNATREARVNINNKQITFAENCGYAALMCGKAVPFREAFLKDSVATPQQRREQERIKNNHHGKSETFRTSDGRAVKMQAVNYQYEDNYARAEADFLLAQKEKEFSEALQLATGVVVDTLSDTETVAPNGSLTVSVRVFAPTNSSTQINSINLKTPKGWKSQEIEEPRPETTSAFRPRRENAQKAAFFRVTVPENEKPTQPYWLQEPRNGYVFNWADDAPKNKPFADSLISCEVKLNIGGVDVIATKNAQYRYADDIRGEIRRELNVVPALSVSLDSKLIISAVSNKPKQHRIAVRVTNNAMKAMNGVVSLRLPNRWKSEPANAPVSFAKKGDRTVAIFNVTVPNAKADAYNIAAQVSSDGKTYDQEMHVVAYPHIQTHRYYTNAETNVRVIDLKVAPVRVGYIMGSGDAVPEAIKRMGLDVTLLGEEDLSSGDLSRFDTIVVGIRASQVRPDFVANNGRLLDFVKSGGTLIVQYQQQEYVNLKLMPFPAQMASRVTDENAKVTILQPQHAAFNFPNKITDEDFNGWVQERNLYNFTTFDSQYTPLLESHDAGETEQKGGQVYAEIGKGKFVYTSYAWFRQLPNGVPGAYRMFANLLSLPKATKK